MGVGLSFTKGYRLGTREALEMYKYAQGPEFMGPPPLQPLSDIPDELLMGYGVTSPFGLPPDLQRQYGIGGDTLER